MAMLRPPGKASKIAAQVLKNKGVETPKKEKKEEKRVKIPFLQH